MPRRNRREFLADVGRGMLVASLGSATAIDLGLTRGLAADSRERLTFGELEPLVSLLQQTAPEKLLPLLVEKLKSGTELGQLVTSAALANARAFGGQDYVGYHTFMALLPAWQMAAELPAERRAVPVLKVIHRNSRQIHKQGVHDHDVLHPTVTDVALSELTGEHLRDRVRAIDWRGAEAELTATCAQSPHTAFDNLQFAVQDEPNVHRVVLSWRAWALLDLAGEEYAATMLRQSLRYCLDNEDDLQKRGPDWLRTRDVLPRLLNEYHLAGRPAGDRRADDAWVEALARTIYGSTQVQAAEAAAAALAEGIHPEDVGEAISLAANLLVLNDPGRVEKYSTPEKPPGCVHGDSRGVHASDSANAWRNIARVSNPRNQIASLIVGAYHTAGQSRPEHSFPYDQQLDSLRAVDAAALLGQAEEAIRGNDQALACAVAHRYCERNFESRPLFDLLLKYAVSEDGALHAEKYYRTVCEEYATTRPAFRSRQLIALARVTASGYGFPAPGYGEACELLGIS